MQKKISLIGAGNIGGTIAHLAYLKQLGNIVLFDINEGVAKGKALDIAQSSFVHKKSINIIGTNNYEDIKDSDVVIVTAGVPRKPGMSRDDLIEINTKVISEVAKNIAKYSPNAFVICVTNPLDVMVWVLQQVSKLPKEKVVGMAGILDSSRFAYFLSQALNIAIEDIQCFVLGGHGDTMVPVINYVSIGGISLESYIKSGKISQEVVDKIVERTRNGGGELVNLMGTSAFYAPAASALSMAESYLLNQNRLLPCAVWVDGKYNINGLYVGVPAIINNKGVANIVEINLIPEVKVNLDKSVKAVEDLIVVAKKFL
jgi:malate dehydrogenase